MPVQDVEEETEPQTTELDSDSDNQKECVEVDEKVSDSESTLGLDVGHGAIATGNSFGYKKGEVLDKLCLLDEAIELEIRDDYKFMSRAELMEFMDQKLAKVIEIMGEEKEVVRALMTYYKWVDSNLLEDIYSKDNGKEHYCQLAGIELIHDSDLRDIAEVCCICTVEEADIIQLDCSHGVCNECLHLYVMDEVLGKRMSCIKCPQCEVPLKESHVLQILGTKSHEFERNLIDNFVETNPDIKWCPSPDTKCGRAILTNMLKADSTSCTCICTNSFCFKCGNYDHEPISCELLQDWMKKIKNEADISINIVPYGGFSDGETPVVAPVEKSSIEDEKWNNFYMVQYVIHQRSLILGEKLSEEVGIFVHQAVKASSTLEKREFGFILDALTTLKSARQTLMSTYALAYYLKPNCQLDIFQQNQGFLETAIEDLAGLLETIQAEWNRDKHSQASSTQADKDDLDLGHLTPEPLQHKVKKAVALCKNLRDALLGHAAEGSLEFQIRNDEMPVPGPSTY